MTERWLPIRGFPYSVSENGSVRRETPEANTYIGRLLITRYDKDGYLTVALTTGGITTYKKIHRLVCSAFHGEPKLGQQCRHLDGNKDNCHESNLCWGTAQENADDRDKHGTTRRGENSARALFTQKLVDNLRKEYQFEKQKQITLGKKYIKRGYLEYMAEREQVDKKTLLRIMGGAGY